MSRQLAVAPAAPIEHFLLVVVLRLNDLVPDLESPSKPLHRGFTGPNGVQSTLKHDRASLRKIKSQKPSRIDARERHSWRQPGEFPAAGMTVWNLKVFLPINAIWTSFPTYTCFRSHS